MNKRQLYESIMKQVSREVKKALNEEFDAPEKTWKDKYLPGGNKRYTKRVENARNDFETRINAITAPSTKEELQDLIILRVKKYGNNADLNDIDVSNITDMSYLFQTPMLKHFNGYIDQWDVSNVTNMKAMFRYCEDFNQDINVWDVSNVVNMSDMFYSCESFNQPLNNWNVYNVTNMDSMFGHCYDFDQPLNNWDISNVQRARHMFSYVTCYRQNKKNCEVTLNAWKNTRAYKTIKADIDFDNYQFTHSVYDHD